jgi:hypothetical protein
LLPLLAVALAACAPKPQPRTFLDFMDDGFAREGVLTRCNQNREATLNDEECANARRAAAAIALEAERARAPALEERSEAKLAALRERQDRQANAGVEPTDSGAPPADSSSFGAPVGPVLPSISRSPTFDVYADGSDPRAPRAIEVEAEPPSNDLVIAPRLDVPGLAVVPRPFKDDTAPR